MSDNKVPKGFYAADLAIYDVINSSVAGFIFVKNLNLEVATKTFVQVFSFSKNKLPKLAPENQTDYPVNVTSGCLGSFSRVD